MQDQRNMIIAIVLSIIVLFGWQFLIVGPKMEQAAIEAELQVERDQRIAQQANEQALPAEAQTSDLPTPNAVSNGEINQIVAPSLFEYENRQQAITNSPRVKINTSSLLGSINLIGARLDDLELKKYHETVDDSSPIIAYLSPSNAPNGYFIEQGWVPAGNSVKLPNAKSLWKVSGNTTLKENSPITLTFDNGEGLEFSRTFSIDENYLFSVTQSVKNNTNNSISLFPYSRIARYGEPDVTNFFVLHEGAIGVLGEENLVEKKYKDLVEEKTIDVESEGGWLGFTDKYWAATIMPEPGTMINARFSWNKPTTTDIYQSSFVGQDSITVAANSSSQFKSYVFAGAKVESIIDQYEKAQGFDRFELLIDWGWFHFITKPMFYALRWLHSVLGNFGLAILALTVVVKALFFPLANRSYASMAGMRKVQPEMKALQERYKDDKMEQQKAVMELYKREKISPLSGCWPMLIQIPVFFSLYKVLFVTIEMRHAPFFGWIVDLAAPDPTRIFNLFGLLPYDPATIPVIGGFLAIGIWPVLMGMTMWVQFKLNPPPPDPSQAMIFSLMPILFTFLLGTFPAGLVIYWTWNNLLSVTQQYFIMKKHGAEVNLLENIMASFKKKKPAEAVDNPLAKNVANENVTKKEAKNEKPKTRSKIKSKTRPANATTKAKTTKTKAAKKPPSKKTKPKPKK